VGGDIPDGGYERGLRLVNRINRVAKVVLWGITALAAVFFAFPYWSAARPKDVRKAGYQPGAPGRSGPKAPNIKTAYIEVKGMVQQLGIT